MNQPTHLYRYFDERDCLLYVGVSASAIRRLLEHAAGKVWAPLVSRVDVQTLPSKEAALIAEKTAIEKERPRFNVQHNRKPLTNISVTSRTAMLSARIPHSLAAELQTLYGDGKIVATKTEAVILALTCGIAALATDI